MSQLTQSAILVLRICGLLALAAAGNASAQWTNPYPEYFPDFVADPKVLPFLQPDGKRLFAGHAPRGFGVIRMNPDGTPDRGFGKQGLAVLTTWGAADYANSVVAQADGKILVGGNAVDPAGVPACVHWAFCNNYIAVFRLDVDGRRDQTFNGSGRLVLHIGEAAPGVDESDFPDRALDRLALQPDGTILIVGWNFGPTKARVEQVTARVLANGTLDTSFIRDDHGAKARDADFTVAVEFYSPLLDQFFVTADGSEITGLDPHPNAGWRWSGSGFHVHPANSNIAATVPTCRFYGRPEAGLDSHVLSANADECAVLAESASGAWILESDEVFRVELPDTETGACAAGRAPVYRLWNGRRDSGHHLTIDRALRERLLARGYVAEGWGPDGVAMCAAP